MQCTPALHQVSDELSDEIEIHTIDPHWGDTELNFINNVQHDLVCSR